MFGVGVKLLKLFCTAVDTFFELYELFCLKKKLNFNVLFNFLCKWLERVIYLEFCYSDMFVYIPKEIKLFYFLPVQIIFHADIIYGYFFELDKELKILILNWSAFPRFFYYERCYIKKIMLRRQYIIVFIKGVRDFSNQDLELNFSLNKIYYDVLLKNSKLINYYNDDLIINSIDWFNEESFLYNHTILKTKVSFISNDVLLICSDYKHSIIGLELFFWRLDDVQVNGGDYEAFLLINNKIINIHSWEEIQILKKIIASQPKEVSFIITYKNIVQFRNVILYPELSSKSKDFYLNQIVKQI